MIKLMYITVDTQVATIAMNSGIDRIFVDMEVIGKHDRQGGMNTVQSKHTIEDIARIKTVMQSGKELLVRTNPLHEGLAQEVEGAIAAGADILMLPYFFTAQDVAKFVEMVAGRCKVMLLIENKESAIDNLDEILAVDGVDEYHVGLNDLNLSLGGKFMFEPLANGLLDKICHKLKATGKPYGFGGMARVDGGELSGARVLTEHYRQGSSIVIVARSFCNCEQVGDINEIEEIFNRETPKIRSLEEQLEQQSAQYFEDNNNEIKKIVERIVNG